MKRCNIILVAATIGLVSWALPVQAAKPLTPQEREELAKNRAMAQEAVTFQSAAAQNARNPGSPVGPPQKVTICYKGHTKSVPEPALPALLKNGATIGPCDGGRGGRGGGRPRGI